MEMMIVVAIIGMMIAVGTFSLRNLTRASLREAAGKTSGAIRFAFDRALMTGAYIRLAVDIERGRLWLEVSKDRVSLRKGRKQHATDKKEDDEEKASPAAKPKLPLGLGVGGEEEDGEDASPFDVQALIKGYERQMKPVERRKAHFSRLHGLGVKEIRLKHGVRVDAVMSPRLEEPVEKGIAYIYFFPQGHAEPAILHLKNKADEYYSVVVHPLTGQARVYNCRYRFPEEFGKDDLERRKNRRVCEEGP